ncbi:MAG: hypothetical protein ACI4TY_02110 [Candidatus Limosilactobacillus intestinavium]
MAKLEKLQTDLQKIKHDQEVIKHRQERQLARLNAEKRKQRTKRLIEKGAMLEAQMAIGHGVKYAPKVPRVSKKDDPQGYAKYQAYKKYREDLEDYSQSITPQQAEAWLKFVSSRSQNKHSNAIIKFFKKDR